MHHAQEFAIAEYLYSQPLFPSARANNASRRAYCRCGNEHNALFLRDIP
jgi:hypothetical protein